jgi:hypothetical protein
MHPDLNLSVFDVSQFTDARAKDNWIAEWVAAVEFVPGRAYHIAFKAIPSRPPLRIRGHTYAPSECVHHIWRAVDIHAGIHHQARI